jgi:hypothetical protein
MGIQSATNFTFQGNVTDPDGDTLTYAWGSSDGASIGSTTPTASRLYSQSGTFEMRLTVTDPGGLSASATASITVGTLSGVWDVTCVRSAYALQSCASPAFPAQFVVTLSQSGSSLTGAIAGAGRTRTFTVPGIVSNPRAVVFGVESGDNVFCGPSTPSEDFYFSLAANETLSSMSSTGSRLFCDSASATKR